ncbi:helix-turn-helix transcriptional regulator [Roseovarius sp.]|uniref:helix-turn-helix transcriptional regulator n=1 Tax=Roseovarius sp. TaxID=1486281 RepID=UPI0034254DE2
MTGDELRALRMRKGLSRPALAALAGLHPDSVKYWESKARIDLRGWAPDRILRALGAGHLSQRGIYPAWRETGVFPAPLRARNRVLEASDFPAVKRRGNGCCGAKTRKGKPCRAKPLPGKRRCKFHGGMSTGPRTPEGRGRIAEAQRRRWRAWRAARGEV